MTAYMPTTDDTVTTAGGNMSIQFQSCTMPTLSTRLATVKAVMHAAKTRDIDRALAPCCISRFLMMSTPRHTTEKARSVPMLIMSARVTRSTSTARIAAITPVNTIPKEGARVRGSSLANCECSRPSFAIL